MTLYSTTRAPACKTSEITRGLQATSSNELKRAKNP